MRNERLVNAIDKCLSQRIRQRLLSLFGSIGDVSARQSLLDLAQAFAAAHGKGGPYPRI